MQFEYGMKLFKHSGGLNVVTAGLLTGMTGESDCGYVRGCNLFKAPQYTEFDPVYKPITQISLFMLDDLATCSEITKKLHDYINSKYKGIIALCFPGRMRPGLRKDFYCHFTFAFSEDPTKIFDEIGNQLKYLYCSDNNNIRKKMLELSRENEEIRAIIGTNDEDSADLMGKLRQMKEKAEKFDKMKECLAGFM